MVLNIRGNRTNVTARVNEQMDERANEQMNPQTNEGTHARWRESAGASEEGSRWKCRPHQLRSLMSICWARYQRSSSESIALLG
jgi:hypothetical protein